MGVYFVTQYPNDIPDTILGQLGNRVQHALRAYTPKDQKAVQVAAETFRPNPEFSTAEAITTLETGEALISFLDAKGAPGIVERAKILFPLSQIGPIDSSRRNQLINASKLYGKYDEPIDRESAFEQLLAQQEQEAAEAEEDAKGKAKGTARKSGMFGKVSKAVFTAVTATVGTMVGSAVSNRMTGKKSKSGGVKEGAGRVVKNATSAATRTMTREITRSILGNLIK